MKTGVAYFGNRMPKHAASDLQDIAGHGCTYVVHTFSENDWTFYHRTMKEIFDLSRSAGLATWVDPWGVGQVFGGEAFSRWVAEHPELGQRDQEGRHIPAACLNQPAFRRFVHAWIAAAVALEPDVIFWDEPHLFVGAWGGEPERWSCRCDMCRDLYRQRHGESMPVERTDPGVQAFRAWSVVDFLSDIIADSHRQGVQNALCVYPEEVMPDPGPAWSDVASIPGLDNLGTDPYPFLPPVRAAVSPQPVAADLDAELRPFSSRPEPWADFIERNARKVVGVTRDHRLDHHLWIQAFRIPAAEGGFPEAVVQIATAAGVTNLAAWGYDACAFMSWISCERPAEAWQGIGRAFRALRARTEVRAR